MFSQAKVIEIYRIVDDFCKKFAKIQERITVSNSIASLFMEKLPHGFRKAPGRFSAFLTAFSREGGEVFRPRGRSDTYS